MGIIYSLLGWASSEGEPDPVTGLTPNEIQLIKNSWARAAKDRGGLGATIMLSLFEAYPEYKKLFPFRDVPDDQLKDNLKFKVHCSTVVYTLGQLVDHLESPELILAMLDKLASNHIRHGSPPEGFTNIQPIIEAALKPIANDAELAAWSKMLTVAMTYTTKQMLQGNEI